MTEKNELKIGTMIRHFLNVNNMTMKQLGEKLNKSESNVSKWIKGTSTPQAKDLSKMTYIFQTDIQTLMFGGTEKNKISESVKIMKQLNEERKEKVYDFCKFQLEEQKNSID